MKKPISVLEMISNIIGNPIIAIKQRMPAFNPNFEITNDSSIEKKTSPRKTYREEKLKFLMVCLNCTTYLFKKKLYKTKK
jgi:hypothetical protein